MDLLFKICFLDFLFDSWFDSFFIHDNFLSPKSL